MNFNRDGGGNYLIANTDDFIKFADYVNGGGDTSGKTFKLTNDININGKWTPVGREGKLFDDTFDDNNHTISNVIITAANEAGFFGFIDSDASIKNLKLNNVNGNDNVGGLVGLNLGNISNCKVDGSINGTTHVGSSTDENVKRL